MRLRGSPGSPIARAMGRCLPALLAIFVSAQAQAHNPDTSYARFAVSRTALDSAFIFDVTTLLRIAPDLDANGDHRLTPDELKAKTPAIADFLREHVALEVNGVTAEFGELQPVAWPAAAGDAIAEKDYHAATSLVTFAFHKPLDKAPDDFSLEFKVFDQLGSEHNILSMIQQDESRSRSDLPADRAELSLRHRLRGHSV